jgi:hypothetical protein
MSINHFRRRNMNIVIIPHTESNPLDFLLLVHIGVLNDGKDLTPELGALARDKLQKLVAEIHREYTCTARRNVNQQHRRDGTVCRAKAAPVTDTIPGVSAISLRIAVYAMSYGADIVHGGSIQYLSMPWRVDGAKLRQVDHERVVADYTMAIGAGDWTEDLSIRSRQRQCSNDGRQRLDCPSRADFSTVEQHHSTLISQLSPFGTPRRRQLPVRAAIGFQQTAIEKD